MSGAGRGAPARPDNHRVEERRTIRHGCPVEDAADSVLEANGEDVTRAEQEGISNSLLDRLRLDGSRLEGMAAGLRSVAALPDPVGEVTAGWRPANGLDIARIRVPLGVVASSTRPGPMSLPTPPRCV